MDSRPGRRTCEPPLRPALVSTRPSVSSTRNASRTEVRLRPDCATSSRSVGRGVPSASPFDRISSRSLAASTSDALGTTTVARSKDNAVTSLTGAPLGGACRELIPSAYYCQLELSDQRGEEPCRPRRTERKPASPKDGS